MPLTSNSLTNLISSTTTESLPVTIFCAKGQIRDPECEKHIISAVNGLLSNRKTRLLGLELVNALLAHCSREGLAENALYWATSCAGHHTEDTAKELKLKVTAKIVAATTEIDTFNRKFPAEHLLDTFKACSISRNTAERLACLECLGQCMRRFPGWFGNHKQKVETLLIQCLDSRAEDVAELAAEAFHVFAQTGGAGANGVNYINNFANQFKKLCATLHSLYDVFFEGLDEMDNSQAIDAAGIEFADNGSLEVTSYRIMNCVIYIRTMIKKKFPVEKRVIPKYVIDVVRRALNVHICLSEGKAQIEPGDHFFLLQKIQMQLLKLLRILIIGHLASLLPFSHILTKTLLHALTRTNSCMCYCGDPRYKLLIYKILDDWLVRTKTVRYSHVLETLVPLLHKDITPIKSKTLSLNVRTKNKSKASFELNGKQEASRLNYVDENVCLSALQLLTSLLRTCPNTLNSPLMKETSSFIIRTILDVQTNRSVFPYDNTKCRAKLSETLVACYIQEHDANVPPLHLAVSLLNVEVTSSSPEISKVAKEGLELLEKISQPVCNTLYLPASSVDPNRSVNLMSIVSEEEEVDEVSRSGHEINIISNIVIRQSSTVEEQADSGDDVLKEQYKEEPYGQEVEDSVEVTEEEVNGKASVKIDSEASLCDVGEVVANDSDNSNRESVEEDLGEPPVKRPKEEEDVKRPKENEDVLEDMLLSFQDIPQEEHD